MPGHNMPFSSIADILLKIRANVPEDEKLFAFLICPATVFGQN